MRCIKKLLLLINLAMFSTVFSQEVGISSYYGNKFHGRKTASGSIFNKNALTTAAPKRYPFGTMLRVTNLENNRQVIVKVTDRGGFEKLGRLIDLSEAAFKQIADPRKGLVKVKIEVVE